MVRSIAALAAATLVALSVSGAARQPPEPIPIAMPAPQFGVPAGGPFSAREVRTHLRPLGPGAPPWARRLYRRSVRALLALTDPRSGALIAGARDGWDYVWPRDAAAGAIALEAAGLHAEARRVVGFLSGLDLDRAARFHPDGSPVPGRPAAGDGKGWVRAAERALSSGSGGRSGQALSRQSPGSVRIGGRQPTTDPHRRLDWRNRQDYGENVTGDLLGNAIASGAPPGEIQSRFLTSRGLAREQGRPELDSASAWAATVFPSRDLRGPVRTTLRAMARESSPYGIPPIEGWTPGEVWTAPTAWAAWALVELGQRGAADRLLTELRRAATRFGTLPERVDARTGRPTSTTPLAWSHAFAILALRARWPG